MILVRNLLLWLEKSAFARFCPKVGKEPENPHVGGSIPPLATTSIKSIGYPSRGPSNRVPTLGLLIRLSISAMLATVTVIDKARLSVYVRQLEIMKALGD